MDHELQGVEKTPKVLKSFRKHYVEQKCTCLKSDGKIGCCVETLLHRFGFSVGGENFESVFSFNKTLF